MINMYAYTYPGALKKFEPDGFSLIKIGDSTRDVDIRINEQGSSAEWERKIKIGVWNDLANIKRDYDVHEVLHSRGLHYQEGNGTEWFRIPGTSISDVHGYIDDVITDLEGRRVRKQVQLRQLQERTLDQAMAIISQCAKSGQNAASIIANLCPRFGKTIWALSLFNRITEKYGNRIMLLPAYWLGVHGSFNNELDGYDDFLNIREINPRDINCAVDAQEALRQGLRILVPISLHGDLEEWKNTYGWIASIPNQDIFTFADEGDFGTHTENQIAKLEYLFKE